MKKMNRTKKSLLAITVSMGMILGTNMMVFAANDEAKEQTQEVVPEQKFSVEGNGQVLDQISDGSTKEFYTIQTKNNNTYYLVIDHANSVNNVYMLSEIDENDLKDFLTEENQEEEKEPQIMLEEETESVADVKDDKEQEVSLEKAEVNPWKNIAMGGLLAGFLAIVGGIAYYFKIYKPKKEQEVENDEGLEHMEDFETINEEK